MHDGPNIFHAIFGAGGIVGLLMLIFSVLMFMLPFFVFKIRNEVVAMNKKLETIIDIMGSQSVFFEDPEAHTAFATDAGSKYRICPSCGAKNREKDHTCINCSKPL
jgi:zinc-ribbon domain